MSLRIRPIVAEAVSLPAVSTETNTLPATMSVAAKTRSPDPFLGRRRLAGQRVLVDHGHPLDDMAVHRHDLAGIDHDDIAGPEPVERDLDLGAVAVEPGIRGCLPKAFRSIFLELSWVRLTSTRPKPRHQQSTAPGKIAMVPRQPTTTIASSTSTPSRFSLTRTLRASRKVGIDV